MSANIDKYSYEIFKGYSRIFINYTAHGFIWDFLISLFSFCDFLSSRVKGTRPKPGTIKRRGLTSGTNKTVYG